MILFHWQMKIDHQHYKVWVKHTGGKIKKVLLYFRLYVTLGDLSYALGQKN